MSQLGHNYVDMRIVHEPYLTFGFLFSSASGFSIGGSGCSLELRVLLPAGGLCDEPEILTATANPF